jgi:peptidoglycan-N-acetylglucosamine deacetylase
MRIWCRFVTAHGGPCQGCEDLERLGRRRFLKLLASGAALVLAGCNSATRSLTGRHRRALPPLASTAPIVPPVSEGPPPTLGPIPPPSPGPTRVISAGPPGTRQLALTIDDGYCGDCIARYVEFAQSSGIHITFNPNGVYTQLWTPSIVAAAREMVTNQQVQIGNHTWDHANLLGLSSRAIASEITRNEDWIEQTFGITARPYFRPPYGAHSKLVDSVAADLGYTSILLWNGTLGDATVETPTELISLAERWLQPGTIVLGHLNHPTVLSLFDQLEQIIDTRNLQTVTLDEMFGTSRATG